MLVNIQKVLVWFEGRHLDACTDGEWEHTVLFFTHPTLLSHCPVLYPPDTLLSLCLMPVLCLNG